MGRGRFVRMMNDDACSMKDAVDCGATYDPYGRERHCEGKKGAGLFQDGAKGIGIGIHVASPGWDDVFTKRSPNDVQGCTKAALASLKKRLELRAVAVSPRGRIEAPTATSGSGDHKASS